MQQGVQGTTFVREPRGGSPYRRGLPGCCTKLVATYIGGPETAVASPGLVAPLPVVEPMPAGHRWNYYKTLVVDRQSPISYRLQKILGYNRNITLIMHCTICCITNPDRPHLNNRLALLASRYCGLLQCNNIVSFYRG